MPTPGATPDLYYIFGGFGCTIRAMNTEKPKWPYREPKMFAAGNGQWAKKIRGRRYHFGPWRDPKAALERFRSEIDAILDGDVTPPAGILTTDALANLFLAARLARVESAELSARMFDDYRRVCGVMLKVLGRDAVCSRLTAADFAKVRAGLAKSNTRRANEITWLRTVFKWGYESDLLDRPVKFGPDFKRPKAGVIRKAKNIRGKGRLYTADQVRKLVGGASPMLKVAILLGINAGFGNTDCSSLEADEIDLDAGVIKSVRHKTGFGRTAPLWPETVEAIRDWLPVRPKPRKGHGGLLLLSPTGLPLVRVDAKPLEDGIKVVKCDVVITEFMALAKKCGIKKGFYDLRHTFRTVAEAGAFRERTIDRIMGHQQKGIGTEYIHDFLASTLRAVTDYVRAWYLTQGEGFVPTGGGPAVASGQAALPAMP